MNTTSTEKTPSTTPASRTPPEQEPSRAEMCAGMEMPRPQPEHEWLERFVGEWSAEIEAFTGPGQPPMTSRGIEKVRRHGGFWIISEGRNEDFPYEFRLTLGYDPQLRQYVATWADTMLPHLWTYRGSVDAAGRILSLETEGPMPGKPEVRAKFRELTEFKDDNHRIFTSSIQEPDGKWNLIMRINLRKKG